MWYNCIKTGSAVRAARRRTDRSYPRFFVFVFLFLLSRQNILRGAATSCGVCLLRDAMPFSSERTGALVLLVLLLLLIRIMAVWDTIVPWGVVPLFVWLGVRSTSGTGGAFLCVQH